MPNFKKSNGFKMQGTTLYGKSPLKSKFFDKIRAGAKKRAPGQSNYIGGGMNTNIFKGIGKLLTKVKDSTFGNQTLKSTRGGTNRKI